MAYTHNRKKGAENAVWRDPFDGDIFNMFAPHLKEKSCGFIVSVQHIVRMLSPAFWATKRTRGREMSQVPPSPPLYFFFSFSNLYFVFIFFYPSFGTPEPWCHYTALYLKLSRHICIEKLFAYQTAGPLSSHHISLIYREMLTVTCWSACPLYLHLPFAGIS